MAKTVPLAISHTFAWVEKAKKFSVFPRALDERFESDGEYLRYSAACRLMYAEAKSVTLFDIAWNHEKPGFSPELAIKSELLKRVVENSKRVGNCGALHRVNFDEVEFLWDRRSVKGFLKCAVVIELVWPSTSIFSLYACSDEPAFVQGANDGLRLALNHSKKISKKENTVAILFRGTEVEIFPHESILADLFVEGFEHCYKR